MDFEISHRRNRLIVVYRTYLISIESKNNTLEIDIVCPYCSIRYVSELSISEGYALHPSQYIQTKSAYKLFSELNHDRLAVLMEYYQTKIQCLMTENAIAKRTVSLLGAATDEYREPIELLKHIYDFFESITDQSLAITQERLDEICTIPIGPKSANFI